MFIWTCSAGLIKSLFASAASSKTLLGDKAFQVQRMIQEKLQKVQEIKRDTQKDILDSVQVFIALIASILRSHLELIWVIKKKQKGIERGSQGCIKALEQQISALQRRCTELEQLSPTISMSSSNNQREFSIQSSQEEVASNIKGNMDTGRYNWEMVRCFLPMEAEGGWGVCGLRGRVRG